MKRREFMAALGTAGASYVSWPLSARAQQVNAVIGYLHAGSAAPFAPLTAAARRGLAEAGFVEGRNVTFERRAAEGRYERLPALAAELVSRRVAVIAAVTPVAALAAAQRRRFRGWSPAVRSLPRR